MIRQEILPAHCNEVSVDFSAAGALGGDNDDTPAEVRTNAGQEDAIEAADSAPELHELGQDICEDINDHSACRAPISSEKNGGKCQSGIINHPNGQNAVLITYCTGYWLLNSVLFQLVLITVT